MKKNLYRKPEMYLQPALEVGEENDEYEQEANDVANKVMSARETDSGNLSFKNSEVKTMNVPQGSKIRTMKKGPATVRKMFTGKEGGTLAPEHVEQGVNSSKGNGHALPEEIQQDMGNKMGADLSDVKIHTDENAVQMTRDTGAKAFTHGNDIYFSKNQYNPSSREGKHLLAHELTHTVQQSGATGKAIQQQKETYPYDAEIATMYNTPLFESASADSKRLMDLDRGTKIEVLAKEGVFYKVKAGDKTGYVKTNMVAKSVVGAMQDEYDDNTTLAWQGSSAGVKPGTSSEKAPHGKVISSDGGSQFSRWAAGYDGFPLPDYETNPGYGWNCWELILQFAMNTGRVKESFIKRIYQTQWPKKIVDKILSKDKEVQKQGIKEGKEFHTNLIIDALKAKGSYEQTYSKTNRPKAGDLIFFDGVTHVAIATGNYPDGETEILSFWNNPSSIPNKIQKTTIEDLSPHVLNSANVMNKKVGFEEKESISITWTIPPWVDETIK